MSIMKISTISEFDSVLKIFDDITNIIVKSIDLILESDVDHSIKQYMLKHAIKDYRLAIKNFREHCTYNEKNYCETDYFLGLEYWDPMPDYDQFVNLNDLIPTINGPVQLENNKNK
jgi:hypothetical protein